MATTKITKNYYIKGIKFDSIEEYIALKKIDPAFQVETFVGYVETLKSEHATPSDEIRRLWAATPALTPKEAISKYHANAQQLMLVLTLIGPENILSNLKAEKVDEQTITKTQLKTFLNSEDSFENVKRKDGYMSSDMFTRKEVTYDDVYQLYRIDKAEIAAELDEDVYILRVQCPSTAQNYFIFVDAKDPQCKDAIGAVAWTMIKEDGSCLSKEEYLKISAES